MCRLWVLTRGVTASMRAGFYTCVKRFMGGVVAEGTESEQRRFFLNTEEEREETVSPSISSR